jgi:hypothetical protein
MPEKIARVLAGSRNIPSEIWRAAGKIVYSRTMEAVSRNPRPMPTGRCRTP